MIALTAKQRINPHPRLYLKELPEYRYSRIMLTRLGIASLVAASFAGFVLVATIAYFT